MKKTIGLLSLLGISQTAFAEDRVRTAEVQDCYADATLYRVVNPKNSPVLEVYALPSPKEKTLIDRFPLEDPDAVFGSRLDLLLGYIQSCLDKEEKK